MRHPLLRKYGKLIDFIGQVLGEDYELALFDLKSEGYPLIMVAGGLNSGRPLGTPLAAPGLAVLKRYRSGDREPLLHSRGVTRDGRPLRSSVLILTDDTEQPEGLLSIHFDDNRYRGLIDDVLHLCHPTRYWENTEELPLAGADISAAENEMQDLSGCETSATEAAQHLLDELHTTGEALTTEERLYIISVLDSRGYFRLKGAVREVTEVLHCSQASVYRYLAQLRNV